MNRIRLVTIVSLTAALPVVVWGGFSLRREASLDARGERAVKPSPSMQSARGAHDANEASALRSELARVRAEVFSVRAKVDQAETNREEAPERPSVEERRQREQAAIEARETELRRTVATETSDETWTAQLVSSLDASLTRLPGTTLESARCGSSVCVADVRHDAMHSTSDLWNEIASDPVFAGQVMVRSHKEGDSTRTAIYVRRPGAERIRWLGGG